MPSSRGWPTIEAVWQAAALLLPVALALAVPLSAVDLAYAVRAGALTLEHREILRTDPFTFSARGAPWLNQQWLAQVAFALIHDAAGWPGLALVRGVLVGLALLLLFDTVRRAGLDRRRSALLTLAVFVVAAPALALRAQLLAIVLFALALWLLETGRRRPVARWLLIPVTIVWANVHGTFLLAPAAAVVAWAAGRRCDGDRPGPPVAIVAVTLLATLVNPFGPGIWTYALGLATSPIVAGLASEWQPISPTSVPGLLFLAAVVASIILVVRGPVRLPWPTVLWLLALAVLAVRAERAIVWWSMAAGVAFAPIIARLRLPPLARERRSPVNAVLIAALVLACFAALPWWRAGADEGGGLLTDAPADLTAQLEGRLAGETRAYVSQPWASWVEYALPEVRTFVDSRFEVVPAAAWEDYVRIAAGAPDWEARLERWQIDLVIVDPAREPKLAAALAAAPGWDLVAEGRASGGRAYRRLSLEG